MSAVRVTGALLEKLDEPAASQLLGILESQQREATEVVMSQSAERFERRLVEETSALRLEMTQLRGDMREGFADLRRELAASRFELLKWAFAFWVGQLAAVAGIFMALVRR